MKALKNVNVDAKRWSAYAAAGAAAAVGVTTAEQAQADSFYSGVVNINMTGPVGYYQFTPLNTAISNNVVGIFKQGNGGTFGLAFFGAYGQVAGFASGPFLYAYNLGPVGGQVISALNFTPNSYFNTMAFNGGYANSQFLNPGVGMVAFKFISPAEGWMHYGWARVDMTGAPLNGMTLVDWAYSDQPGFQAGQLPEPASLGLLAAGAAGVAMWRRQRRETVAA